MVYAGVLPFADVTDAKGNIERLYLLGLENAEEDFDHAYKMEQSTNFCC
jgi:hypothetical protein